MPTSEECYRLAGSRQFGPLPTKVGASPWTGELRGHGQEEAPNIEAVSSTGSLRRFQSPATATKHCDCQR